MPAHNMNRVVNPPLAHKRSQQPTSIRYFDFMLVAATQQNVSIITLEPRRRFRGKLLSSSSAHGFHSVGNKTQPSARRDNCVNAQRSSSQRTQRHTEKIVARTYTKYMCNVFFACFVRGGACIRIVFYTFCEYATAHTAKRSPPPRLPLATRIIEQ